ncbi:MarR family winged helix-turn-helix transcriptional regulator [Promicromonospora alba]|uniref:MarR family winged helix-turn-helix transcriptional regulator n=1 Tax=Promicromonospora alba TaxID=1616110 RepID=A0ABV9HEF8_9MICO
MDAPKPIGYWLKHLDNLLDEQFAATLAGLGVNRRDWQVLNTLSRGPAVRQDLEAALAPFWAAGEPNLSRVIAELHQRGWTTAGEHLALTDAGRAAHAGLAQRIDETRGRLLNGLTREQYGETVRILSVMAANVEEDLARTR